MQTLDSLFAHVAPKPEPRDLLDAFRPPSRFAPKRFDQYHPLHPSQAAAARRLQQIAAELSSRRRTSLLDRFRSRPRGAGLYLDGGFGVGKTHLLASLWNAVAEPKSYLAFDELMYFIGLFGPASPAYFAGHRLIAVDEWELDDPGNLKLALAFLRAVLRDGAYVAVTSNTLPLELGAGRFSQKDFRAEVEELAASFEVVRIEGEDYRHRRYAATPGLELFWTEERLAAARAASEGHLVCDFDELLEGLGSVHPIRYREIARKVDGIYVRRIAPIGDLPTALRWVHFVDSIYDGGVRFGATGETALGDLFPDAFVEGPFGKKLSRCLSRLEEMLSATPPAEPASGA